MRASLQIPAARPRVAAVRPAARKLLSPGVVRVPVATVFCAAGGVADRSNEEAHKGDFLGSFDAGMRVPNIVAAKGGGGGGNMGSSGSLGAVMERSRLEFVMPTPPAQAPKLDDGGDGGDIGKHNHNGGGGGDDGGDDDDYFNEDGDGDGEGGEGEGGNSFFRTVIPESYDKLSIGAVFSEWMRTVAELPLIIRRAVEMGLFSSAQLVRFFSMDVRPNITRTVSRNLPPAWARDFVGRLMADPAFVQKMVIESAISAVASLYYEYRARGDRFKDELDLVLINTIGMAAATSATVWMVAPTRSYGTVHKFPWQQMLDSLPNCVFDANGPLRAYTPQSRIAAFFSKAAELSAVGLLTGAGTSLLSQAAVALRRKYVDPNFEPSVPVPEVARSSAGLAAFFAISANTRYQLIGGMDRYLVGHSNFLWTYLAATAAARVVSNQVGESHRPWLQGLPEPSALPRRRVVKKKVIVRRKVVKPVEEVAAPEVSTAALAAGALAVGTVAVGAESLPEVEEASTSGQALTVSGVQPEEEVVLDQVLAVAEPGPSSERLAAEAPAVVAAAGSSSSAAAAAVDESSSGDDETGDESGSELASLVAQQSSGAIDLSSIGVGAASSGQLLTAAR
ncbi:hypothetical protein CHLRE_09g387000v5 [Chlamydomonas reinhardtii]|uniref:Uncharacterized protein n=1 Tax=Chlamydomonas reinhardtii TaxID=3055 RepID=A8IZH9_CHLRE|nr:uncharacterized protein CHLRE_09g387000v5 [Chlamydomonas reinhardtii]PNW78681.1 hypothetical protein CHLRE_09g387000v5 [Chlamydomonas reinhardtii]|eukprot:XP_001694418.1 predicted protein [Chlamydomonas reinhardtii]